MHARRILHIFPSFAPGGVESRIVDVANRAGPDFHHLVGALDGRMTAAVRFAEATSRSAVEVRGLDSPRAWPAIRRILAELSPDLLCTYNWGAIDWAIVARLVGWRRHIHFESGFGREEASRPLRRRSLARRVALARTAAVVVPSFRLADLVREEKWVDAGRIRHIVNGVDAAYFAPGGARRAEPPVVLAVGGLRPEKRFDRLVAIFAGSGLAERATLEICGDGSGMAALRAQAEASGATGRICLRGHVDDIRPRLAAASVFAMSSATEQMPNALLQAMAMELPVIAFDAGDIRRMLPPAQHPFVIAQEDEGGYRTGLARLLDDPGLRRELGRENRAHVLRHFTMDAMVEAYRGLYRDAMAADRR